MPSRISVLPLSVSERVAFGATGAILPVLGNVLVLDWDVTFARFTLPSILGFCCKIVVLLFFGAVVGYADKDQRSVWKMLQLGLAAPALFLAMANGHQFKETKTRSLSFDSLVTPAEASQHNTAQRDTRSPFWR